MLKKLIRMNLDDLFLFLCVECGLFLLIQAIIGYVMYRTRPADVPIIMSVLMPIVAGFLALICGITHVGVSFDQALRFGQTRRRGLGLALGVMSFEAAFGLGLAAVLAALERFALPGLWAALSGKAGWVLGMSGVVSPVPEPGEPVRRYYESIAGELLPLPDDILVTNIFHLDWYWWLLIFAAAIMGGTIIGAMIHRFGSKGGWIIWGICMAPMILGQFLPWETYEITNWLLPLLAVLVIAGFLWSIWYLLHAVVRA